jgi:hypothetical protein
MSFSFNPGGLLKSVEVPNKIEFINKYGHLANNYRALNALGEQRYIWFYVLIFISLFMGLVLNHLSEPKLDENNKPKERTYLQNLYLYSSYLCGVVCVLSVIYSGYMYLLVYLPEYYNWLGKLPADAQVQLTKIQAFDSIMGTSQPNYYNQAPLFRFG